MVTKRPYGIVLRDLERLLDSAWADENDGKLDRAERHLGEARVKIQSLYQILEDWSEDLYRIGLEVGREP